jgi:hypothetical protein
MQKVYVKPGETVELILPHSEVCCHMKVAGKRAKVTVTQSKYPAAQIGRQDGTAFSFPVGLGEGGFYRDDDGIYYYPPAADDTSEWLK